VFYVLGLKQSISVFYKALEFIVDSLKRENEYCSDQRLKWLKDLYLNLFYDNANKRFQAPTPMQALLAFGGRQFNFNTLEHNFNSSVNNLINNCQANNNSNKANCSNAMFDSGIGLTTRDEINDSCNSSNPQIRFQVTDNGDFVKVKGKFFYSIK
jgi:hypothetical protein